MSKPFYYIDNNKKLKEVTKNEFEAIFTQLEMIEYYLPSRLWKLFKDAVHEDATAALKNR